MSDAPPGLPTHLRLVAPLGGGGSATVWRARDTRRGRDVALKLLDGAADGDTLEREVRSLARLRDVPGVVAVHECGLTRSGTAWLSSELVEGSSLAELALRGPLGAEEAGGLALGVARTLAAAHALGVVHGDLTPANVVVDHAGAPRVIDLGLALLDGRVGPGGCTPAYAAPERLRGAPPSPASDVFSLGATFDSVGTAPLPELATCRDERPSRRPAAERVADALERARAAPGPRRWWRR